MLDINLLRRDLDAVVAQLQRRKNPQPYLDVQRYQALEAERKRIQTETEQLQAQRNAASRQIGQMKSRGEDTTTLMAEVAGIGEAMKAGAERLEALQAELHGLLMALPNLPQPAVPDGADETANVEVRRWGAPPAFDFTPRDHVDVGTPLGLDFETGVKLAGSRFGFLRGPAARLHRALAAFMLDVQTQQHGYTECITPYLVNREVLEGTGQLPKFEEDLYAVKAVTRRVTGKTCRGPTSRVPDPDLGSHADQHRHANRSSTPRQLPIRLTAHTPCFRSRPAAPGATPAA
jgi:seryl-tRNA synthetase